MSENRKELGRIRSARFGKGGYQEAMLGISFDLGGKGWGVGDFWGGWGIERSPHAKWTEAERIEGLGNVLMRIGKLLSEAHVDSVDKLEGVPIECTFDLNKLVSWRVLTEVLE